MRHTIVIVLILFTINFDGFGGPIPTVPSSIEIAGVHLKLTNDAQREIQNDVNAIRASDKYFQIKLDRVNLYFPIIERVLKEEGVPEVLKYLAVQESSLTSDAVSSANAVGYWQFKDFTAREVGMRVDSKIDERKNIVSSSRGAAKYFKMNNFYFKNWIYSISAYQAGRGGASKYVDSENFGSDKLTITSKTHWYVLRFIAHVIAFQDEVGGPHSEGLSLGEYTKGEGKTMDQIADDQRIDIALLKEYNKWLSHGSIPDDKVYTVIFPGKGAAVKSNNSKEEAKPLTRSIEPAKKTVYPNDLGITSKQKTIFIRINGLKAVMASDAENIVSLALKSGISSGQLIKYNDLHSASSIISGEIYYTQNKRNRSSVRFHVAQHGETAWGISQKYGLKLNQLYRKNRMEENESIKTGRLLWLNKKRPSNVPVEYHKVKSPTIVTSTVSKPIPAQPVIIKQTPNPVIKKEVIVEKPVSIEPEEREEIKPNLPKANNATHVVALGESLWFIANKYGLALDQLQQWNSLDEKSTLSVGQTLSLVKSTASEIIKQSPSSSTSYHTVQPGESLWGIAHLYNTTIDNIRSLNNLSVNDAISIGQSLVVGKAQMDAQPKKPKQDIYETYTVKGGDSLYKISREFDVSVSDLLLLNELRSPDLSVGDVLKIKLKD
ncbi:MAG: membrane-bound lytic murein transglycosylase D [Marinoscillum sp.]|jgi:membrane-bound lytic murein transglycosylase D